MPKKSKSKNKNKQIQMPQLPRVPNAIHRGIVTGFDYMLILQNTSNESNLSKQIELNSSDEDDPCSEESEDISYSKYDCVNGSAINAIKMLKNIREKN